MKTPLVALLSDFGLSDHYVGAMKGEILKLCPEARLVDISHQLLPQSVSHGGFCLEQSLRSFTEGTVFLAVVDPGVGSERRAVAVESAGYRFVAPDNGLLTRALRALGGEYRAVTLTLPEEASHTFHGRDLFAPTAGRLAAGETLDALGEPAENLVLSETLAPRREGETLRVEFLCKDHFGNLCFECRREDWSDFFQVGALYRFGHLELPFCRTFSDVELGEPLLLWNSAGHLELAVRNGRGDQAWTGDESVDIERLGRCEASNR